MKNNTNKINDVFTLNVVSLTPLEDVCDFHTQAMFCYILKTKSNINNLFSTNKNNKEGKNKILEKLINNMGIKDENFKNEFKSILTTYSDVIAISSDDLEPSKLLPRHIKLVDGSKPTKQKAY
jgi:hypothetical protein